MSTTESTEPSRIDEASEVRSVARGSALNVAGALVTAVVSFVTVGLITNNYGRAGAGLFFSATAVFTFAANGSRLGAESGLTFFVSRFRAAGQQGAIKPLIATAVGATTLASVILAILGLVLAPELADLLTANSANASSLSTMIRILAVAVPTYATSQVLFGATRGFGTMRPSVLSGQVFRPIAQFLLVLVAILVSSKVWPLAAAWALASLIAAISVTVWLLRRISQFEKAPKTFSAAAYWRFAAPRAVTDLLSSALERLDILLVAYFLTAVDAGLYGASNRIIVAGQLLMYATSQSMAPRLSASFHQGRYQGAKKLLNTVTAWNVMLLWPVMLTLSFGAETVLSLFGADFAEGADIVRVLALSLALIVAIGGGDTLLLMTGRSLASLFNHIAALIVLVGASALLLPRVGLVGAAWAWALSRILLRSLATLRVWQTTGVHSFGPAVGVAAASAAASFVPSGFVVYALIGRGYLALFVHIAVGCLINLALMLRFARLLNVAELRQVLTRRPAASAQRGTEQ